MKAATDLIRGELSAVASEIERLGESETRLTQQLAGTREQIAAAHLRRASLSEALAVLVGPPTAAATTPFPDSKPRKK